MLTTAVVSPVMCICTMEVAENFSPARLCLFGQHAKYKWLLGVPLFLEEMIICKAMYVKYRIHCLLTPQIFSRHFGTCLMTTFNSVCCLKPKRRGGNFV